MSGTSMATPHIAGVAALYLGANPAATPAQVRDAMVADATSGKVNNPGSGSPNKLVYTGNIGTTTTPPATQPPATTPTTPAGTVCTLTNGYDKPIADRTTVESKLTVANCDGKGSATATVEVRVKHSDRGDLAIWLVAPDGTTYKLRSSTSGDNVRDLNATYRVNLSSEVRNGTWVLRVSDVFAGDTGTLDTWTLKV
jgi:subtilisin family serine protease